MVTTRGLRLSVLSLILIILDYMLPDINGNVVCQRVRASEDMPNTRILCVSGVIERDEIEMLRASGADDFLKKPFDLREIVSRIETLLELEAREVR